jgi:hypothetical protein
MKTELTNKIIHAGLLGQYPHAEVFSVLNNARLGSPVRWTGEKFTAGGL